MSHVPVNRTRAPAIVSGQTDLPAQKSAPVPAIERTFFTPPIDIYETDEGLVLVADLPGVSVETLELQVQDNKLTLLGRVPATVAAEAHLLHKEYEEGDFVRSFILSDDVDHERISARLNNGVLEVVLPRAPRAQPRKIQVNSD